MISWPTFATSPVAPVKRESSARVSIAGNSSSASGSSGRIDASSASSGDSSRERYSPHDDDDCSRTQRATSSPSGPAGSARASRVAALMQKRPSWPAESAWSAARHSQRSVRTPSRWTARATSPSPRCSSSPLSSTIRSRALLRRWQAGSSSEAGRQELGELDEPIGQGCRLRGSCRSRLAHRAISLPRGSRLRCGALGERVA